MDMVRISIIQIVYRPPKVHSSYRYLATDFHMFLIAPLLIKLLFKHGQKIVLLSFLIVAAGGVYRTYVLQNFFDEWDANKK